MRITAPFDSSISLLQLSQTSTVFLAKFSSSISGFDSTLADKAEWKLRGCEAFLDSPRAKQAEERLLFEIEPGIPRGDDAQMPRPEIGDRAPVEVLLDHGRADVGGAAHGGRVPELLRDAAAHGGHVLLRLRLRLHDAVLCEADRREERAAPRAEVLDREVVPHVLLHVLVQVSVGQAHEVAVLPPV